MAKRFIDTKMFEDDWLVGLSKEGKLFFFYYIANCDHAGVFKLNKKTCEFQTGIKNIEAAIKELGNSLVTVKDGVYFMPKFIEFQYPKFPQSNVKQQSSAINILKSLGFWDEKTNTYLTLRQDLSKSYDNDSVSDINTIPPKKPKKITFQESEFYDRAKFKSAMPDDWTKEKLLYYYEAAERYSNEGNRYIEWHTAVRAWAKKDEIQGKVIFKKQSAPSGVQFS